MVSNFAFLLQMKEKLVSAISSFPPPSNPEDALKQSGALAAVTSGPSSTLSADAKVSGLYGIILIDCAVNQIK